MIPYHQGFESDLAARAAAHHVSMYPPAPGNDGNKAPPRIFFKMPRVVPNQRERFDKEDIFKKNSKDQEVRYTPFRDRPMPERQNKFQQGLREGHVEVSLSGSGLVLILTWNPLQSGSSPFQDRSRPGSTPFNKYGCDFEKEPGKVHIRSSLILNGVCVQWKGWIELERLEGVGRLEFDEEIAQSEDGYLQQQIEYYNHRLRDFDNNNKT